MQNIMETIKKDIEDLEKVATLFYQGSTIKGFEEMTKATEKILAIVDNLVNLSKKDSSNISLDMNYINAALTEILNAYEKRDGILIADLLTFELLDYVNSVLEQCKIQ